MKAVIVGDSQSLGAGPFLRDRLKADGYTVPAPYGKSGAGSVGVLARAEAAAADHPDADLVVVFSGSVEKDAVAGKGIDSLWPDAQVVWYGSAPATRITDLARAKTVFGSKVTGPDYWFSSGEAAAREQRNQKLPALLPSRFQYVDWRSLSFPDAVKQQSGVSFPDLPDGIHITGQHAKDAFSGSNWPPAAGGGGSASGGSGTTTILIAGLILGAFLWRGVKK